MGARLLRVLARLVPCGRRDEWLREWSAERYRDPGLGTLLAAGEDALRLRARRHHGWHPSSVGNVVDDLRSATLGLWRAPGFTLVAVLTLGLTIGANTAVLSVADAVLLRPLPYSEPDRVFVLLVATRGIARLAEEQLFDVDTGDPLAYGAISLAVLSMAMLAAWIPARRVSRVDPVVALRAE